MARGHKLFEAMDRNPQGDWRVEDVELVCRTYGLEMRSPKRGSHFTISHPEMTKILTVPSRRPLKPVYIRALVAYINEVLGTAADDEST
jgi:hypothetical protein